MIKKLRKWKSSTKKMGKKHYASIKSRGNNSRKKSLLDEFLGFFKNKNKNKNIKNKFINGL